MFIIRKIFIKFIIILLGLSLISCHKKESFFFETSPQDFAKNCNDLNAEITQLKKHDLKQMKTKKRIRRVENTTIVLLAIPTLGISLFFLDLSTDQNERIEEINNRINALEKMTILKSCDNGAVSEI